MKPLRGLLFVLGLAGLAWGAKQFLGLGLDNITTTAVWLVGGVLAHDGVLAPLVVVLALIAIRLLPVWLRGPLAAGLVVLGSVTLLAIPVLGRFGARTDNPTLLDRNYVGGWLVLVAITVTCVAVAGLISRRRTMSAARSAAQSAAR
ncbi:MAG: hypothetical protein WKF73_00275 [Nocardioidaceae bacterium]